ncbi:tetratricopeptide repeat-containing sensor histidine kinase [Flammeovirga agarivorans]|uniref:histidine kinase n=1 Tax=Flammeovirga agarivorans TaxID=2726742 RepID=A0A7X8SHP4_9BACT|nr:histidine kinase dimerization/phosphoacceptor domain -containing protein [Flammeovirga agarivorans]NLR90337.1 tetratricopeptide repeat protein [Flammeovirga agarivorans]
MKTTNVLHLLLLIISTSLSLNAQTKHKADSLIVVLNEKESTLSKDSLAIYYNRIGYHLNSLESIPYLEKSIQLAEELEDYDQKSVAIENLSNIHRILGNNLRAIELLNEASQINIRLDNKYYECLNYAQLAGIYYTTYEYEEAIRYYKKAIRTFPENKKKLNYIFTINNTGECYRLLKQYDSAKVYLNRAITLNKATKSEVIDGFAYGNLGMVQFALGENDIAKTNLKKGVVKLKNNGDDLNAEIYNVELIKLDEIEHRTEGLETRYLTSYKVFKELQAKEQVKEISKELVRYYKNKGQYKDALFFEEEMILYKDSLINIESLRKLEDAKHQFDLDRVAFELELLKQKDALKSYVSICAAVIAMIFIALSVYLNYESKRRKKTNLLLQQQKDIIMEREEEKALLLKELNHRVKNNLQMISSLLNLQSNQLGDHPAVKAIDSGRFRVEAMSLIHQKLYQTDAHIDIDLKNYLEDLVLNLTFSFDASLQPQFEVDDIPLHIDKAIPLGLIVNELVTNAMKYAFEGIDNPQLIISVKKESELLIVKVMDNGIGLENSVSNGTSFGLHLVDSLVKQLNGTLSKDSSKGTIITLIISV